MKSNTQLRQIAKEIAKEIDLTCCMLYSMKQKYNLDLERETQIKPSLTKDESKAYFDELMKYTD